MDRVGYVGREAALAVVRGSVEDAVDGRGQLLLLVGDPGIGKTALAREAAGQAVGLDVAVAWATCWEGDGAPPYWPWVQVLRSLSEGGVPLPAEVQRLLPEVEEPERGAGGGALISTGDEGERVLLFDAVHEVLLRAAVRAPLLVVLDDLQWADVPSLLLLSFVAQRVASGSLLVIGLFRDREIVEDELRRPILADLRREASVVELTGLDEQGVARLMSSIGGSRPSASLTAEVQRRTAGNPFFVRELVQLMASRGQLDSGGAARESSSGVPEGVRQVLEHRLARLPQACVAMLTVAAVVGRPVGLELLARAGGVSAESLVGQVETAVRAGVLTPLSGPSGPFALTHDLFRETLYDAIPPVRRASDHSRVAAALDELSSGGAAPAELARHYLMAAAGPPTEPAAAERATRATLDAAGGAQERFAFEDAVGLCTRTLDALRLAEVLRADSAADLLLARGEARLRAGDLQGASRDFREVARWSRGASDSGRFALSVLGIHALGVESGASREDLLQLLKEAASAIADEESTVAALVLAALARELFLGRVDERERAATLGAAAIEIARRAGDDATLARCLLAGHDTCWLPGMAQRRRDIAIEMGTVARRAGDLAFEAEACLLRASASLELADPQALVELQEFDRLGSTVGQRHLDYLVLTRRAMAATLTGRFDEAEQALEEGAQLALRTGEPDAWNVETRILWELRSAQGRREEARPALRLCALPQLQYWFDVLEGLALLEDGQHSEAERLIIPAVQNHPHLLPFPYVVAAQWAELGEAAAALGMLAETERFYEALLPFAGTTVVIAAAVGFTGAVDHHLGRLATTLGRVDSAIDHLDHAAAIHERMSAWPWLAHTRLALAQVLMTRGGDLDRSRATELTQAAAGTAAELGMPGLARRIDSAPMAGENIFVRDGETWRICFGDKESHLRDVKGLTDIATLLRSQGAEVSATVLAGRNLPGAASLGVDPVLDQQAQRTYRARLVQLDADLDQADRDNDPTHSEQITEERAFLIRELSAAVGLGGRDRGLGDERERARKAVTARIKDALQRIEAADPELGAHLASAVTTGNYCAYRPAHPVRWVI